jgi:hypothetical protein
MSIFLTFTSNRKRQTPRLHTLTLPGLLQTLATFSVTEEKISKDKDLASVTDNISNI